MSSAKGRRLELRPLGDPDAEALFAAIEASREQLRRRLRWVGEAASVGDCLSFIKRARERAGQGAERVWGLFELRGGALAGVSALQGLARTPGVAELSGWVRSDRLERGYALEAGRAALAEAFKGDGLQRVFARIEPSNRAGRKVIQKLGFRYEGCLRHDRRLNGRWVDQECWGLLRSEWRPSRK